jgi:hypothetical protein
VASQCPVVGSALNWQGQPQLQLQFTTSSPAICHLIFVGSLIFFSFHHIQFGFDGLPPWFTDQESSAVFLLAKSKLGEPRRHNEMLNRKHNVFPRHLSC